MHEESPAALWQLISPTLPIGAFAWSEGLEQSVEAGWIRDEGEARAWILGIAEAVLARLDLPVLARLHLAFGTGDIGQALAWNDRLLASRETSELRAGDRALGRALARLMQGLGHPMPGPERPTAWATAFAHACVRLGVGREPALRGYAWSWGEAQVAAAVRLVPLGETAGQRILLAHGASLPRLVRRALAVPDGAIGMSAPGLAIASARHETQHTRLFRS